MTLIKWVELLERGLGYVFNGKQELINIVDAIELVGKIENVKKKGQIPN